MGGTTPTPRRWNLFARELEDLLDTDRHGHLPLSLLDDRAGIHREKVRRLQQSLIVPKSFPTLNPKEMEQLTTALGLDEEEVLRLRAAILATAVEEMLMDRIGTEDALTAAEQILPVIRAALQRHHGEPVGIGAMKGDAIYRGGRQAMDDDELLDAALHGALAQIDRATLALHLSQHVATASERLDRARQARDGFAAALSELRDADPTVQAKPGWQLWYREAEEGHKTASERIADLGGE